ncbi:MAG: hypothetical protein Q7K40_02685 [bacterium]|nr:hypothetical protein [bacterium]
MYNIVYYDVSHDNKPKMVIDGTRLGVMELVAINLQNISLPNHVRGMMTSLNVDSIDSLGIERSSRWENLMSAIIYCLCGQMPSRQEVLRGRQIMMALPNNLRTKGVAEKIAFSLLPYILIGFKAHLDNRFQSDSNIVSDVATFIARLHDNHNPIALSFLCAHRGRSGIERHVLIDSVQVGRAQVTLNVIKGILSNDPWAKSRSIRWYQQGPTEWACLNMFPEMFLRYVTSGRVSYLLTLLGRHFTELQELMGVTDPNGIKTELVEMDPLTSGVLSFLSERYGASWRSTDFFDVTIKKDQLIGIALDVALPCVVRQMPFYSASHAHEGYVGKKSFYIAQNIESLQDSNPVRACLIKCAIERFFQTQIMHPTAKALYETAFYYVWGKRTAMSNREIAIGIDRDHNNFQYLAWRLGYNDGLGGTSLPIPLLYARRTAEDCEVSALKDYSLRQFWR